MHEPYDELHREVKRREARKLRARRRKDERIWFGLGMFGLVGWAVAVPTLLGLALGLWIDSRWAGGYSWTLMLMLLGVIVGCWNAWYWLSQEGSLIEKEKEEEESESENQS